jgi:two-component system sensor histidine kinase AtoS
MAMEGRKRVQGADRIVALARDARPGIRDPGLWFVLLALAGTTLLHYLTDIHLIPYHSIYRSLYYVPIAVAAVRYGRRGGVLTALTASVLYIPHVILSWNIMIDDGFNDLLENVIFLFVGAFAGTLADAERRQRQRAQDAAVQLDAANKQLQTQVDLAHRMRALIESILESIDSGVLTLDLQGQITTINQAAQTLLGGPKGIEAAMPQSIRDDLLAGARGYQQIAVAGRMLGLHGSALIGGQRETIGTVLVLDDLTERRALEEQVQRAQRLAALGRLAGGLAHEIRNPLAITRAAAQVLQHEIDQLPALGEYTQVIQTEIDRVDRLIEQLLAYARPFPFQRGPVNVADVIERTAALTRAYAAQRGVALATDVPAHLPNVEGDAELLHQALVNLLLNGIHATAANGMVTVSASTPEVDNGASSLLIITVRDTGQGIATADVPHIFDPFFTTRVDGTGLGLSIVQQIVQEHSGTIAVHSELGKGTSFEVRLPVAAPQASPQTREAPSVHANAVDTIHSSSAW